MRSKRSELRQGGKSSGYGSESSSSSSVVGSWRHEEGQPSRLDACYELIKMIAGAGVGMAGGGVGMLRARRRDISIKPNRKLDRKSSRGMIYENEELRLRTIHINAEVEQGQNDIKKLRRENEQLRREIWSLRDEYDKLEEILKKQKSREESDELEDRSGDEAAGTEYSEDDEEEDEEDETDDDESEDDEVDEKHDQEERLENAENQKISTEKLNSNTLGQHRTRINFDDLSVVDEEDELKKDKEKKDNYPSNDNLTNLNTVEPGSQFSALPQNNIPYYTTSFNEIEPITSASFGYQTDCPFVFPTSGETSNYSNMGPVDKSCLLMTACPQLYSSCASQQPTISVGAPMLNSSFDISTHNHSRPPIIGTPPPPAGWQSSVSMPIRGSPITATNFPLVPRTKSPSCDTHVTSSKDFPPKPARNTEIVKNGHPTISTPHSKLMTLAERRKAFFNQYSNNYHSSGPAILQTDGLDTIDTITRNCNSKDVNMCERSIDAKRIIDDESILSNASMYHDNKPRHFFAPMYTKSTSPCNGDNTRSIDDIITARHSDNGNSPSSEKTTSTVISRNRFNCEKGSADICVNGAVPDDKQIDNGDAKAFFSSENLLVISDLRTNESSNSPNNPLTKSVSCQDLNTRLSFVENFKSPAIEPKHAKSDNALDNKSTTGHPYKSQLNVTLKQPKPRNSPSPDTPEIPRLPPIDYKLFNNPFLQNFEQDYQNFPVRTEGQNPVSHPLSIQVCESPVSGGGYSSPVKMQPSFSSPNTADADCGTCKRKDMERLRLMIPPAKLIDPHADKQEFHVTSFETPSPHTVQIPPMTPYELEALRRMPTGVSPVSKTPKLYQNVPFVPRGAAVYCPGQGMKMYYDTVSMKVPAQTQTSLEDGATNQNEGDKTPQAENNQITEKQKKRRSRKEKSGSVKEKKRSPGTQRRKELLKKQTSTSSKDIPESPGKVSVKKRSGEAHEEKNESRSSSSGQESPRKDQTKRVSLYFNAKKRPSLTSVRTSRSRSIENTRDNHFLRGDTFEGTNSERERTNSVSSREVGAREKTRKSSTSSGSVPWCACWGNGCI